MKSFWPKKYQKKSEWNMIANLIYFIITIMVLLAIIIVALRG